MELLRTDSNNKDFRELVASLDEYLRGTDGDEHAFFAQYNKIDMIRNVIIAYKNGVPAACGAFKEYTSDTAEIKRMYVKPEFRRMGMAKAVLSALEQWAAELQFSSCILETGKKQVEAVHLYQATGYTIIPNYGQYATVLSSLCMKKPVGPVQ